MENHHPVGEASLSHYDLNEVPLHLVLHWSLLAGMGVGQQFSVLFGWSRMASF